MQKNISLSHFQSTFNALKDLPKSQIQFLLDRSSIVHYPPGSFLFKADEPAESMTFVLEGCFQIYLLQNGNQNTVAELETGDITGILPFSRMEKARASAVATEDSWALHFPRSAMRELIQDHYELTESLVHEMTGRVRNFTTLQLQNERMISLGKLSAGLAHELNNPTAAIGRSAKTLETYRNTSAKQLKELLVSSQASVCFEQIEALLQLFRGAKEQQLGLLAQQEMEEEWLDFFEDRDYPEADNLIEHLVQKDLQPDDFETIIKGIDPPELRLVLNYLSSELDQLAQFENIASAANRISELVSSIKSFTHMDQAQDKGLADLSRGIESTLKMLDHKIRKAGIRITKDYQEDLVKVPMRVGQMNQVFTNILDNAIDALKDSRDPSLTIRLYCKRDKAYIKIEDNGPGVPEELKVMIFDPFFTTKGVGEGSGLGLEISRRIVEQHQGKLELESAAKPTIFSICLPLA